MRYLIVSWLIFAASCSSDTASTDARIDMDARDANAGDAANDASTPNTTQVVVTAGQRLCSGFSEGHTSWQDAFDDIGQVELTAGAHAIDHLNFGTTPAQAIFNRVVFLA